jgi:hypothetical protein
MTTSTTFINFINTGTSPNSGNGDSLRTAFNKINVNFQSLLDNFVSAGVSSFNNQTGIITFTGTDIISNLGFTPYPYSNPEGYITSSTANLQNLASINYVNSNFVSNSNLISYNYVTQNYVDAKLTEYPTLVYLNNQNFLVPATLPDFLTGYATLTDLGNTADNVRAFTTSSIYTAISQSSLIPDLAATYNLGQEAYTWGNLYLGGAVYIQGIGISVDPVTGKLFVNGNNVTGGFSFTPTAVWNDNNINFTISSSQPNATTNKAKAGISFPADSQTNNYSLELYNTGTYGIALQGLTTTVSVDKNGVDGLAIDGNLVTPITLKGEGFLGSIPMNHHSLVIKPNESRSRQGVELIAPQQFVSIDTTATHAPLLFKGSRVAMYAFTLTDTQSFDANVQFPSYLALDEDGVYIGRHYNKGFGEPTYVDSLEGYKLPLTRGTLGQVLGIASTGTVLDTVEWVNGGGGTSEYTPTTPADWTGSPTVGTVVEGLDELAFRVSNVEGLNGSALSNLVNGPHTFSLGADGVLTLPSGNTRIGNINGTDGILGSTGTGVAVSSQGQGGYAGIQWIDDPEDATSVAGVIVNSPIALTSGTVQIVTGIVAGPTAENIWEFSTDGTLSLPYNGSIEQNYSWTRTSTSSINTSTPTVVWTANTSTVSGAKLMIQVEANEIGDATGWHSQVAETIIASRGYTVSAAGPLGDPAMSVYGVTHTSVDPLTTFTVQRNPTTKLIEVMGTITTATTAASLRIYSVETATRD